MFYALAEGTIDTGGWTFEHVMQDIQTLNERALRGELDITAISIHAYPYVADQYALTSCGSSMGDGYGPLVVTREPVEVEWRHGTTEPISKEPEIFDGQVVIKREILPDGRSKLILKDPQSGDFSDRVV